ncbi:MAG: molecular chaperone HtpG [Alphaproteobacteria bacterium]|nr:molecular chaperone HtpG [Alphaproteobacteria bacterium]
MTKTEEKIAFKAEVAKVLDIVIHSLYSNKEIFLRELISNGSDACDKLRYATLMHPELKGGNYRLTITPDKKAGTLTITDNGIGMNKQDLIDHLGTIARSGSAEFLKSLSGDKQKDMAIIGQFGVGFYASFMVADKVSVRTHKAGEDTGWLWESTGAGEFTISEDKDAPLGTSVILHLKKEDQEFLDGFRLRHLVKQYSDFVNLPIFLKDGDKEEAINSGTALWMRPKSEITPTQYKDFYQTISHAFDTPWETLHFHVEGVIDYTALLFIPTEPPMNLFQPDKKGNLSLYVNKVFISDEMELLPYWLRFVAGVIDTKDLPLNVSREMLQQTPVLTKIRQGLTTKILNALKKRAEKPEEYNTFWKSFGIVLKEGLYEPSANRDEVAALCRFYSTNGAELITLKDYISRMKKEQKNIYYLTGSNLEALRSSPQLEGLTARGIEVLLLTDPIDEFWTNTYPEFEGHKFIPVQQAGSELEKIKPAETKGETLAKDKADTLLGRMKSVLGDVVKEVKLTDRLTDSAVALTTGAGQMSLHLERLMRAHGQKTAFESSRILEVNPRHPLIHKLADMTGETADDTIHLLYDQALLAEGEQLPDPAAFNRRLMNLMMK